jgi:hypothetical protein
MFLPNIFEYNSSHCPVSDTKKNPLGTPSRLTYFYYFGRAGGSTFSGLQVGAFQFGKNVAATGAQGRTMTFAQHGKAKEITANANTDKI